MSNLESPKEFMYCPWYESMSYYRPGGYHPIDLGDIFNDRYEVILKLAYTSRSTLWLVEDLIAHRFASLRVLSAEVSAESSEMHVAEHLKKQELDVGNEHVMKRYMIRLQYKDRMKHTTVSLLNFLRLLWRKKRRRVEQSVLVPAGLGCE